MSERRNRDAVFKARASLETVKEERMISVLAAKCGVHAPDADLPEA
jgi:hypothetical protein